jgi:hypothetical protein
VEIENIYNPDLAVGALGDTRIWAAGTDPNLLINLLPVASVNHRYSKDIVFDCVNNSVVAVPDAVTGPVC